MTITGQALDLAAPAWPYPGVATVRALITALGAAGQPAGEQEQVVRQFTQTPAWEAAPPVLQRDVHRWLGLLWESQDAELAAPAVIPGEVIRDAPGAPGTHVPGYTGQGWSSHETMLIVRWLFANPAVWDQAMAVARDPASNPHTVADTLHETLVPRSELDAIAADGFDPAKVNWLEIAHELIERRGDPQAAGHANDETAPAVTLAASGVTVAPQAMKAPGLPVPGNKTAIAMFTAHRVDDMLRHLAHARERMHAARNAAGALRQYHAGHLDRHLQAALDSAHEMTDNLREHYGPEAAELEQVKQHVGLAKAVSDAAKAATTAHLTETTLHELTHGKRHAAAMLGDHHPDGAEWEFNADHAAKHLDGAVDHASRLGKHFRDNYPAEGRWLARLGEATAGPEEGGDAKPQHARYSKGAVTAQLATPGTISGQATGHVGTLAG